MVNDITSPQLTNIEKTLRKGEPTNFDISLFWLGEIYFQELKYVFKLYQKNVFMKYVL